MAEVDWTPIHPDHRERLHEAYGAGITQEIVNSLAVSFPADGVEAVHQNGTYVVRQAESFDSLRAAVLERAVANQRLADAEETFRLEIRGAYRAGATAAQLADIVGLSHARVAQLVAGARK